MGTKRNGKKLRYKWKEAASPSSTSSINPGNIEKGIYVAGTRYVLYREIRLLPSLVPILWPTFPANLVTP